MFKIIIILLFISSIACTFLYEEWRHAEKEKEYYKDLHSSNVIEGTHKLINQAIDSFKIPIPDRRIISDNHTTVNTTNHIFTTIRDSTVHDSIHVHCLSWIGSHARLSGCLETGLTYTNKDTLDIVRFMKPEKYLIQKWKFIALKRKDTIQVFNKDTCSKYNVRFYTKK